MQWKVKNRIFCEYLRDAASGPKTFLGQTNVVLMFPFPWLDWGIDILGFEKIDFLTHEEFLWLLAP